MSSFEPRYDDHDDVSRNLVDATRGVAVVRALVAVKEPRAALNFALALWRGDVDKCGQVLEELDASLLPDHYHRTS